MKNKLMKVLPCLLIAWNSLYAIGCNLKSQSTTETLELCKDTKGTATPSDQKACLDIVEEIYLDQEACKYSWMITSGFMDKLIAEGLTSTVCYSEISCKTHGKYDLQLYNESLIAYLKLCKVLHDSSRIVKNLPLVSPEVFESHISTLVEIKDTKIACSLYKYTNSLCVKRKTASWAGILELTTDKTKHDQLLQKMQQTCNSKELEAVEKLIQKF